MGKEEIPKKNDSNDLEADFQILDDLRGLIRKMMFFVVLGGTILLKSQKLSCSTLLIVNH